MKTYAYNAMKQLEKKIHVFLTMSSYVRFTGYTQCVLNIKTILFRNEH